MVNLFSNACKIQLYPLIYRYLIANTAGRLDGWEKAQRHREMCQFYVAVHTGIPEPENVDTTSQSYAKVHTATQALTDYLDEVIGFPLSGTPNYDSLVDSFFVRFHQLALEALIPGNHYKF